MLEKVFIYLTQHLTLARYAGDEPADTKTFALDKWIDSISMDEIREKLALIPELIGIEGF